DDGDMAKRLRRSGRKVILAVNKIDNAVQETELGDFYRLGLKKMFTVSAEHGRGMAELLDDLVEEIHQAGKGGAPVDDSSVIKVAILGRPNVGKSTLLNRLYGAPRAVVHPEPGTTRDSIDIEIEREGRTFRIIDTAGIRKKSHSEGKIEK